ncbi:MAG: replicative DNA helicase [Defluviitaleaceae bacterium]|nr:replicative DNA helicase [Defluviitaleaceae bacterium]
MQEPLLNQNQRPMPRDEQAELALISAMIFDNEALSQAAEVVKPEDFYRVDYRLVFACLIDLYNAAQPVDPITLKSKLEERDAFDKIGGAEALTAIISAVSTSANIKQYIKIVLDRSILRRLITAAGDIMNDSFEATKTTDAILDNAEAILFAIGQKRNSLGFFHIHDVLKIAMKTIEAAYANGEAITGVSSGFADLDRITSGFHPSDLILIAARPSMGKTALVLNIASHIALRGNLPVAIFSLEMSKDSLASRMLSSEAKVDAGKIRNGRLEASDWDSINNTLPKISQAPLFIDDTPGISVAQMRSKCRKLKLEYGLGMIVIDYIQLMSGSGRTENRQQEISEISRSLKALAREMEVPVIALSQLSRAVESRGDRKPILSDLRESGAIEQDADLVCFIYRDEYYNPETEKQGIAEIIIAKQRNGATGTVELQYIGNQVRFADKEYVY